MIRRAIAGKRLNPTCRGPTIPGVVPTHKGSIRLFRFAGINVFLHWSWFLAAIILIQYRRAIPQGDLPLNWEILEYLALFAIVLMHEFGHSLACRSVGGQADQIVLWPLGGVAFVDPPQRPGATLWSIAAGPLVNVCLIPILGAFYLIAVTRGWEADNFNLYQLICAINEINIGLLVFNLLPIYPMDGGQILRSLLWFGIGRARSLMVATMIGLIAIVLLLIFAIRAPWLGFIAAFIFLNCWSGFQQARVLLRVAAAPRRGGLACPHCQSAPPVGEFWGCGRCRAAFDMFASGGVCPKCGTIFNVTRCLECGEAADLSAYSGVHS